MKNTLIIVLAFMLQIGVAQKQVAQKQVAQKQKANCKIVSIGAQNLSDNLTILVWNTKDEVKKMSFIIETYSWGKWIKIGEVYGHGTPALNTYLFKLVLHRGENTLRVSQTDPVFVSDSVKVTSTAPKITYSINKETKEIEFSDQALYIIYDSSDALVKQGFSKSVSIENLPEGEYKLNYDDSSVKITR